MAHPSIRVSLTLAVVCAAHAPRTTHLLAQSLPADAAGATARIAASPRHGEWVSIAAGPTDSVRAWVVYPERRDRAPVVVVIHEIFGLSDWIRGVADQLAAEGFIAIAPDLLSGKGPGGGGTESVDPQGATRLIRTLTPEEITRRLTAAAGYATRLPAARAEVGSIGFCWGGTQSFLAATYLPGLRGAVVYYGTSLDSATLGRVSAPVLGLYGADDARVVTTIAPARAELTRQGKRFETEIYEGAGHGFLRDQPGREGANRRATEQAWPRTVAFLRATVGR